MRNRKRTGERSATETEWEEWEGRANFHNEKVIICGVRVSFSLVSVACQLLARGHCVVPAMHTNSLTKPRPHGLPLLKNVSFTFLLPSHLSNPINPHSLPSPASPPPFFFFFCFSYISLSFSLLHPRDQYGNEEYTNELYPLVGSHKGFGILFHPVLPLTCSILTLQHQ